MRMGPLSPRDMAATEQARPDSHMAEARRLLCRVKNTMADRLPAGMAAEIEDWLARTAEGAPKRRGRRGI